MIHAPKRSVTRFFIPLIDVLILLFCIFLLMPLVENVEAREGEQVSLSPGQSLELIQEVDRLRREVDQLRGTREGPADLRAEIARLRHEKLLALKDRLVIRTLQIDPQTGVLTYQDPEKKSIRTQNDALELIDRDRKQSKGGEVYYLILYPRERSSGFPTVEQRADYERWFQGVALGFDIPARGPGGKQP